MKNCTDCLNWAPELPEIGYCELYETSAVRTWCSSILNPLLANGEFEKIDCSKCPGFLDADVLLYPPQKVDFEEDEMFGLNED